MSRALPIMKRQCGPCQMCCVIPAIAELGKPANTPCVHLTPQGCGIYETRPQVCRDFSCSWLDGDGDSSIRPERVGFYVTGTGSKLAPGIALHSAPGDMERWQKSGAWRKRVKRMVERGYSVFLLSGDQRRVITKNQKVLDVATSLLKDGTTFEVDEAYGKEER